MHSLRAIYIMWLRDLLRFWRDRTRIVASLTLPILWLIIFGSGLSPAMRLGGTGAVGPAGLDYQRFLFPGIVGMTVLFTALFSALSIAFDREFGFLKEILVAPVSRYAIAIGKTLGGSTIAVLQGTMMLIFAPFLGVTLTPLMVLQLLGVMLVLAFALTSMGIALASAIRTMEGFQAVMQFVTMPMFLLSGAMFPLQNLPLWMDLLAKINPVSYGVDPLRQIVLGPTVPEAVVRALSLYPITIDLAVVAAFGGVMIILAVYSFEKQS